ncbi:MAG: flagellar basal body rod C-terminal domain-containing protein, partial [Erysipelotrichaceae bacterium]
FPTKDADGNSTGYKQIISGDLTIDASNITVSSEWLDDPSFILKDLDNAGSLDNTHILDLISKLEGKGNIPGFEGSFADFIDSYVTTLGQDKSYVSGRFDASYAIITDLENKRDAISAVSLDEEGANLMVFDKAYKATSRLMTTFDEALDVLINKTGLVGR